MHKAKETSTGDRDRFRSSGSPRSKNGQRSTITNGERKQAFDNQSSNNNADDCRRSARSQSNSRDHSSVSFATYTGGRSYLDGRNKGKRGRKTAVYAVNASTRDSSCRRHRDQSNNRKFAGKQFYENLKAPHVGSFPKAPQVGSFLANGTLKAPQLGSFLPNPYSVSSHALGDSDSCASLASVRSMPHGPVGDLLDRAMRMCSVHDSPMVKPHRDGSDCGYIDATIRPYLHGRLGIGRSRSSLSGISTSATPLAALKSYSFFDHAGKVDGNKIGNKNINENSNNNNKNINTDTITTTTTNKNNNNNNNNNNNSNSNNNNYNNNYDNSNNNCRDESIITRGFGVVSSNEENEYINSDSISSIGNSAVNNVNNHIQYRLKNERDVHDGIKPSCVWVDGYGEGDGCHEEISKEIFGKKTDIVTRGNIINVIETTTHMRVNYHILKTDMNTSSFKSPTHHAECRSCNYPERPKNNSCPVLTLEKRVIPTYKIRSKNRPRSTHTCAWLNCDIKTITIDKGCLEENELESHGFKDHVERPYRYVNTLANLQGNHCYNRSTCTGNIFIHQNSNNNSSCRGSSSSCISSNDNCTSSEGSFITSSSSSSCSSSYSSGRSKNNCNRTGSCTSTPLSTSISQKIPSSTVLTNSCEDFTGEIGPCWSEGAIEKYQKASAYTSYSSTSMSLFTSTSLTQSICSPSEKSVETCVSSASSEGLDSSTNTYNHLMKDPLVKLFLMRTEKTDYGAGSIGHQGKRSVGEERGKTLGQEETTNNHRAANLRHRTGSKDKIPVRNSREAGESGIVKNRDRRKAGLRLPTDNTYPATAQTTKDLKQNQKSPTKQTHLKTTGYSNSRFEKTENPKFKDYVYSSKRRNISQSPKTTGVIRPKYKAQPKRSRSTVMSGAKEYFPEVKIIDASIKSNAFMISNGQLASSAARVGKTTKDSAHKAVKRPSSTVPGQRRAGSSAPKSRRANTVQGRKEASIQGDSVVKHNLPIAANPQLQKLQSGKYFLTNTKAANDKGTKSQPENVSARVKLQPTDVKRIKNLIPGTKRNHISHDRQTKKENLTGIVMSNFATQKIEIPSFSSYVGTSDDSSILSGSNNKLKTISLDPMCQVLRRPSITFHDLPQRLRPPEYDANEAMLQTQDTVGCFDNTRRSSWTQKQEKLFAPSLPNRNSDVEDKTERWVLNHMHLSQPRGRRRTRRARSRPPGNGRFIFPCQFRRSRSFGGSMTSDACLLASRTSSFSGLDQADKQNTNVFYNGSTGGRLKPSQEYKDVYLREIVLSHGQEGFNGMKITDEISTPAVKVVYKAPKTFESFSGSGTSGRNTPTVTTKATLNCLQSGTPARTCDKIVSQKWTQGYKSAKRVAKEKKDIRAETETCQTKQNTSDITKQILTVANEPKTSLCNPKEIAPPGKPFKRGKQGCSKKSVDLKQINLDQVSASVTNEQKKQEKGCTYKTVDRQLSTKQPIVSSDLNAPLDQTKTAKVHPKQRVGVREKYEAQQIYLRQHPQQGQQNESEQKQNIVSNSLDLPGGDKPNLQPEASSDPNNRMDGTGTLFSTLSYASAILDSSWPPTRFLKLDAPEDRPLLKITDDIDDARLKISALQGPDSNVQIKLEGLLKSFKSRKDQISVTRSIPDLTEEKSMEKTKHRCGVIRQYIQDKYVCLRHTPLPCRYFNPGIVTDSQKNSGENLVSPFPEDLPKSIAKDDSSTYVNKPTQVALRTSNSVSTMNLETTTPVSLSPLEIEDMKAGRVFKEKADSPSCAKTAPKKVCTKEMGLSSGPCAKKRGFKNATKNTIYKPFLPNSALVPRIPTAISFAAYDSLITELKTHYLLDRHYEDSSLVEDNESLVDWDDGILDDEKGTAVAPLHGSAPYVDKQQPEKFGMKSLWRDSHASCLGRDSDGNRASTDSHTKPTDKSEYVQKLSKIVGGIAFPEPLARRKPKREDAVEATSITNESSIDASDSNDDTPLSVFECNIFSGRGSESRQQFRNSLERSLNVRAGSKTAKCSEKECVPKISNSQLTVKNQQVLTLESKEQVTEMACEKTLDGGLKVGFEQNVEDSKSIDMNLKQNTSLSAQPNLADAATQSDSECSKIDSEIQQNESFPPNLQNEFKDAESLTNFDSKTLFQTQSLDEPCSQSLKASQVTGDSRVELGNKELVNETMVAASTHLFDTLEGSPVVKVPDGSESLSQVASNTHIIQSMADRSASSEHQGALKNQPDNHDNVKSQPRPNTPPELQEIKTVSDSPLSADHLPENLKEVAEKLSGLAQHIHTRVKDLSGSTRPLVFESQTGHVLLTASEKEKEAEKEKEGEREENEEEGVLTDWNVLKSSKDKTKQNLFPPFGRVDDDMPPSQSISISECSNSMVPVLVYNECKQSREASNKLATAVDIHEETAKSAHKFFQIQYEKQCCQEPQTEPLDLSLCGSNNEKECSQNERIAGRDIDSGSVKQSLVYSSIDSPLSKGYLERTSQNLNVISNQKKWRNKLCKEWQAKLCRQLVNLDTDVAKKSPQHDTTIPSPVENEVGSLKDPDNVHRLEPTGGSEGQSENLIRGENQDDHTLQVCRPCVVKNTCYITLTPETTSSSDSFNRIALVCNRDHENYLTYQRSFDSNRINLDFRQFRFEDLAGVYWQLMCYNNWNNILSSSLIYQDFDISRAIRVHMSDKNRNPKKPSQPKLAQIDPPPVQDTCGKQEAKSGTDTCKPSLGVSIKNRECVLAVSKNHMCLRSPVKINNHDQPSIAGTSSSAYRNQPGKLDPVQPNSECKKKKPEPTCTSSRPPSPETRSTSFISASVWQTAAKFEDRSSFTRIPNVPGEGGLCEKSESQATLLSESVSCFSVHGGDADSRTEPSTAEAHASLKSVDSDCSFHSCCSICNFSQ
ncbi:hypothetical protein EGW08_001589 [Elysia chlorotica]|uniref:Uncharacterized protein n=1 Tax=Elysia chlorotica TaxID=188477 RepID=A0A3S1A4U1_ELYCH|nr:hypothetical protein EGW08_001589 [Elysia chlorotica]